MTRFIKGFPILHKYKIAIKITSWAFNENIEHFPLKIDFGVTRAIFGLNFQSGKSIEAFRMMERIKKDTKKYLKITFIISIFCTSHKLNDTLNSERATPCSSWKIEFSSSARIRLLQLFT